MRYPKGLNKNFNNKISHANRGMVLEEALNETNNYYLISNKAVIYKKPTPILITKVDYPSRDQAIIKEAYFKTPSTTDYNGIYKGKYIDFEAKETRVKNFPLKNIHKHQIDHLQKVLEHGGISFLIVLFTKESCIYILKTEDLLEFLKTNKKAIPLDYFKEKGFLVKEKYNPRIDYLKVIDEFLKED